MNVQRYTNPTQYYERIEAYLEAQEVENSLILGLAQRMIREPGVFKNPYLATVQDDAGALQFVVMHTPPFGITLSSHLPEPIAAIDLLVEDLLTTDYKPPNTFGSNPMGKLFAQTWAQRSGGAYRLEMSQGVYKLETVASETLTAATGSLRRGVETDISLVTEWRKDFEIGAFGKVLSTPAYLKEFGEKNYATTYFWEDEGQPVSMCMRNRPTRHGITISLVYTPAEARRRGYATALVAQASQSLLDEGYDFCTLFTDLDNPTSNAIYMKIGYEWVCQADKYKLVGGH